MKADIPLSERVRLANEEQREVSAALVRRHFDVLAEERAMHAACMDHNIRVGPAMRAALDRVAKG